MNNASPALSAGPVNALPASYLRPYGESNSVRVRRAIGYVFAGHQFGKVTFANRGPYFYCEGPAQIYFYPDNGDVRALVTADRFPTMGAQEDVPIVAYGVAWTDFLKFNDACSGSNRTGLVMPVPRGGPVEFDRAGYITFDCVHPRPSLFYKDSPSSSDEYGLKCQEIQPGAGR